MQPLGRKSHLFFPARPSIGLLAGSSKAASDRDGNVKKVLKWLIHKEGFAAILQEFLILPVYSILNLFYI